MINKVKRKFVLGAVILSAAMALAACDLNGVASNNGESTSSTPNVTYTSSAINDSGISDSSVGSVFLDRITAVSNKESYEIGDELDLTVTAYYSNGDVVAVSGYEVSGFNNRTAGEQAVTISYGGVSTTVTITVNPAHVVSLTVVNNQEKYEVGDDLDLTVTATYSDGTTNTITEYDVSGYDNQTPGTQTVVITYEGKTGTTEVIVNVPVILNIEVIDNKAATGYQIGEELDLTVKANYSNHVSYAVTDYEVSGYDNSDFGTQTIAVKYEEKTATLDVVINEPDNLFPGETLNSFLQDEKIQASVPTPVGYKEWTKVVDTFEDGNKYFAASTDNNVLNGKTTVVESYSALLEQEGWNITSANGVYYANKENADAQIEFTNNNGQFNLYVYAYEKFPSRKTTGNQITNSTVLKEGTTIVLGNVEYGVVATGLDDGAMQVQECQYNNGNMVTVSRNAMRLKLSKLSNGRWSISDKNGRKLGNKAVGEIAWDEGTTEWIISISTSTTLIVSGTGSSGYLVFNQNTGLITTVKSSERKSMKSLQVYSVSTVDVVYPTALEISGNTLVSQSRSTKLSVKFTPSNTTEKGLVWSSSDENIAKVDKNGVVSGVSLGTATITATAYNKDEPITATFDIEVVEQVLDRWTILFYICGADLESRSGLASGDITEMLSTSGQPEDINLVIQTGGSNYWSKYGISSNKIGRYHIENKSLVQDASLSNASMGSQNTLESFVNWGLEEYPAEKTGLVLWNHGGAFEGCCYDENYSDDSLEAQEIAGAMENVFTKQGLNQKLEWIGYDCCLMQLQDLAEFNSPYFNYMVGSEETEAGDGWAYDKWLDNLYAGDDTETILIEIADTFIASNDNTGGWWSSGNDQTLSVLNLNKMVDYLNTFESMCAAIKDTVKNNYSTFKSVINSCKKFEEFNRFGLFDGKDFLNKLASKSPFTSFATQINDTKTAFGELVTYSKKGGEAGNANGLAFFAPLGTYGTATSYPSNQTHFNNWKALFN